MFAVAVVSRAEMAMSERWKTPAAHSIVTRATTPNYAGTIHITHRVRCFLKRVSWRYLTLFCTLSERLLMSVSCDDGLAPLP